MKLHQWSTEFSGKQRQLDVSRVLQHLHHLNSHSPYKSENIKPTRFLNYSLTPGNTACADTLEWWMQKKKCTPRRKFTCNLKSNPLKKANHLPNLHLGVPRFFSGVYNVWGNFFIHFSSSLQVPPRLPTRRYLCFFQSLRGIIDLPAARLVHHQNAIQVLQIVEVSVLV